MDVAGFSKEEQEEITAAANSTIYFQRSQESYTKRHTTVLRIGGQKKMWSFYEKYDGIF